MASSNSNSHRSAWYADRQLVPDESAVTSLALYKTLISNPVTDIKTRKTCYTKLVALLDSLPAVRSFNSQSINISQGLYDLLEYRCNVHRELAQLYCQTGDTHNACHLYDRTTKLLEVLLNFIVNSSDCDYKSAHSVFQSLALTLEQWIDLEEAMGRKTKAEKLGIRLDKWRAKERLVSTL